MNSTDRTTKYQQALAGIGNDTEVALARICVGLRDALAYRNPQDLWAGAILVEITPEQLQGLADASDWPGLTAMAGLADDAPDSTVIRVNRRQWHQTRLPGS